MNWKTAAKAYVAALTAFLGFLATKEVSLDPIVEAALLAVAAGVAVYQVRNS